MAFLLARLFLLRLIRLKSLLFPFARHAAGTTEASRFAERDELINARLAAAFTGAPLGT